MCIEKDSAKAAYPARQLNDYGFFSSVSSLLDIAACLEKTEYVFDVLHADSITLFTRYGPDNHDRGLRLPAYLGRTQQVQSHRLHLPHAPC